MRTETTKTNREECPDCGRKAKRVGTSTLRALLKDELARKFLAGDRPCCNVAGNGDTDCSPVSDAAGWRFCESQDCDVVYFCETDDRAFTKSQLRVAVGIKEKTGQRPLCYCFGHSIASIKEELRTKGRSDAPDDIRAKMKDPGCRCEVENPSGSCCLGNVAKGIKAAQDELGVDGSDLKQAAGSAGPPSNRGELIAKAGTVVSAIMASACCWLPLTLLAMGVSGAGIASALEAYRPYFMVVTFGFLGAAFYYTYRPRKAAAGAGHACRGPAATSIADCCASANQGRFSILALNKVMLWVVTVMGVAFLLFPSYAGTLLGGDSEAVTENMNQTVVSIEGMTCEGCSAIVAKTIRSVPGVLAVDINYSEAQAVVGTKIGCPIPKNEIQTALQQVGYSGKFVDSD